jgi:hypothetical protein
MKWLNRLYNANPPNNPAGGQPPAPAATPPTSGTPPAAPAAGTPPGETQEQKQLKKLAADNKALLDTNNALLSKVAQLSPPPKPQPPPQQQTPQDARAKWWTDPEAAFNEKTQPLVQSVIGTNVFLMKEQMKSKYAKEFKLWEPEIDELIKPLNPMYLTDPQTWEIIIERVRGRHVQDYARDPSMVAGYSESNSPSDPPGPKPPEQQLSARELQIAKQLGVTPEKYLLQKSKMTVGT